MGDLFRAERGGKLIAGGTPLKESYHEAIRNSGSATMTKKRDAIYVYLSVQLNGQGLSKDGPS